MSKLLSAVKDKFVILKRNALLRTALISAIALLLILSVTFAWYINNQELYGMEFHTGTIQFNSYVYDDDGVLKLGPVSSDKENETAYKSDPLITLADVKKDEPVTFYIMVESTGTIGIDYRIAFNITGTNEKSNAYLGGYKYNIDLVPKEKVKFTSDGKLDVSLINAPAQVADEVVTIERNAEHGTIEDLNGYDVYRVDFMLPEGSEEYTDNGVKVYYTISATQIGGDFDSTEEKGVVYYCADETDIDRAKVEAYPGDIIKLTADITYYGDLVFNKPIHLETNDHTLTVKGNLMYDYVLSNSLRLDVGGLGKIIVQCTKEGVGGNFQIKTPISNVTLTGANAAAGDILVEKNFVINATNADSSTGVSFHEVRITERYTPELKTIQLESNTKATVSFGTTIGTLQAVVNASNIEIVNNGIIETINLTNMALLAQTNSPQIDILNNKDILNAILLPQWSVKFRMDAQGNCTGNTRIIQSYTASETKVSGTCDFDMGDVEVEKKELLVEQIVEGYDTRLKIYYQDDNGATTSIQSILEDYLKNKGTNVDNVEQLQIISIGDKAVTNADIAFMNSNSMKALMQLDMQRANMYDEVTGKSGRLPDRAYAGVSKYYSLILPQNLTEIGVSAFDGSKIQNIITIPSSVEVFGANWFRQGYYVNFADSTPPIETNAVAGVSNVKAIFVDEAYISSYKSTYTDYANKIYPTSILDETKQHFVRNTKDDEWEITYYISGEDDVIGGNIIIDGSILKITSVYDNAYRYNNYSCTEVKFANSVINLGAANFYGNAVIKEVDLNNLKYIGDNAFSGAKALAKVTFGNYHETIGANAFLNCVSLNQDVFLPETMQKIGASAFQNTKITAVKTGGTTSVDGYAFYNCAELIYAELPNVKVVGENGTNYLFANCERLVSVKMPALIKANGYRMFDYCVSLREVYMNTKDDAFTLGSFPFNECKTKKLKIYVPEDYIEFYETKLSGSINKEMIYPQGEKMEIELVNEFDIGAYIVGDNHDGSYTLITSNIDHSGTLTIPTKFNGKPITRIYDNAFRNQNFTNVLLEIGDNITAIGSNAFYQCIGLLEVDFGNSLKVIEAAAFAYCTSLVQDVELPDSMESIGSEAFRNTGIVSVKTGGATAVETRAFAECASLVYVQMPKVTTIAASRTNEVFSGCISMVSVDMPMVTKVYGMKIFQDCTALVELYLGNYDENFSLGSFAFNNVNKSQIKLYVPENLVSKYQDLMLLDNANQVYPRGEKLGEKYVKGFDVGRYIVLENDDGYTLVTSNLEFAGDVVIPDTCKNQPITEIYDHAFVNQTFTDANLVLGNNVKIIGNSAFYGITGLKSVAMDQVTTIGTDAFYGSGIQVLNAPKLTAIASQAFRKCTSLENISIPRIETIESSYVFADCTNLKSVYFENVMSLNEYTFYADKNLEKITINRLINSNGDNMPAVMSLGSAPNCKIYVPYHALSAYTSTWSGKPVESFDISATYNGDTYILADNNGRYTLIGFEPGTTKSALVMPTATQIGGITIYSIDEGALSLVAGSLKDLTLSSTIAQLNGAALSECSALQNIYVDANNMYFKSVNGVLYSTDAKMLVKYPAGRSGSFDMTAAEYASTVGIGAGAFANATNLTQIVFSGSLMVIDSTAFTGCTQLRTVEFTGKTPPVLMGAGIFDTTVEGFKMVIPTDDAAVVTAYLCAYNFGEYEPYIDLNGNAAPTATTPRNQVHLGSQPAQVTTTYAVLKPIKDDEEDKGDSSEDENSAVE